MSYKMASAFMDVYDLTSLAVLQCFYTDVSIVKQKGKDQFDNFNRPTEMNVVFEMITLPENHEEDEKEKENEKVKLVKK
jgi:hypothetical protein